ncbi:helicase protein MOM1 isoform X3 [Capsicum galapagoense]
MASDTRSGRKNKDTESNKSKNKQSDKGSLSSGSGKTDKSSLRRSGRETKQATSSPSSTTKSKRLEKQPPSPPTVKRRAGLIEKPNSPSPLRRSDRGKKPASSSSSRSSYLGRGSDSSVKKKEKREKSVKELIMEAESYSTSRENGAASVGLKRKTMDARTYKALFKKQRKRYIAPESKDKLESPKKSSIVEGIDSDEADCKPIDGHNGSHQKVVKDLKEHPDAVASARSISSLEASAADASVNDLGESPYSNRRCCPTEKSAALPAENGSEVSKDGCTVGEISGDSEMIPEGCSVLEDNLHIAELTCSTSTNGDIILKSGEIGTANCSETHNDTCDLAEVSPPPLRDLEKLGEGGTCASCSRQIRLNHDSPEEELCSCAGLSGRDYSNLSSLKDRVGSEAASLSDSREGCNIQLNEALSVSQRGSDEKMCATCKQGGKMLICNGRGCRRCYHLSCLDPPLDDFPPGAWHCNLCVKKKIESGVHSVTEGVESILDVREVEVAGTYRQKQYLVKYHGLAHAHNCWVAEAQLLIDAPLLIANYNHRNQDVRWISEWTVPHRLLKKRSLMFSKLNGQDAGDNNKCLFEWLVKWKGLGYEYATWELENANFLKSQHGESLIKDFNIRREKAKRGIDKLQNQKGPLVKLSELSAGGSLITDSNVLNNVNKLRECWLKCQNTAVFDDQDRIKKMVLFILSLSDVCCPFLIVTTSSSLLQWEAEFTRWAPSIDVVVYSGRRDSRRRIKSLEFYDEGGFRILQVLLSSLEAVIEDVEILSDLSWEVTIIDDCQNVGISAHVEQIKMLAAGVRVLLFNGPMKITSSEYLNLLSLLECKFGLDKTGGVESDFSDHLGKSKRVTKVTAPCSKPESSKYMEYWVPVQISDLQLEQYCSTLLTNSNALRTFSKSDPVGALRDILLSVRKCCDHPYILDPLLQPFNKGLSPAEMLEVGIKASGKLQFLDKMLAEMRLRQHRVVVLFQSIVGSGPGASIGDILDDFLRQRFGEDSYERIETGVVVSKKQASLHRFNNKGSGRFVLLLENRVCNPSIKLSSVDSVIIYDSETNPANDLRQLQKISIDSQSTYISVFRLYSCFTVEERSLVLAKQDLNLDSNLHNISRSPNNTLMWGASNLFSRLDGYHSGGIPSSISNNSSGQLLLNDVISEFSAIISLISDDKELCHSIISKVQISMGTYRANIPLFGEKKMELKIGEETHVFWRMLLEGRNPQWRNLSTATPRSRKRVQYFDESPDPPNGNDEAGKKRRKVVNHSVDAIPTHPSPGRGEVAASKGGAHENNNIGGKHVSRSPSHLLNEAKLVRPEEGRILYNEQKSLHIHLKAEFAKLFQVLKLSDAVKHTVRKFLEYVMENHRVSREPATILQAFQLSLCWVAASILKQKIDKEETFLLAKQHLQFGCTEEEANNVCLKIRSLKKLFLQRLDQNDNASSSSKCSLLAARSVAEEPSTGGMSQNVESPQLNVQKEMEERFQGKRLYKECTVTPKEELVDIERENFIKEVQCRCERRMSNLLQKQKEEIEEFQKIWEKKKEELEQDYRLQFAVLRSIFGQNAATKDRQKTLETEYSKKMQELKCHKDQKLKELKVEHSAMENKEMQKAASWLAKANSFRGIGSDPIDGIGCSQETVNVSLNSPWIVCPVSGHLVEELNAGNILDNMRSDVPASTSDESDILPIESTNVLTTPATKDVAGVKPGDRGLVAVSKRSNEVCDPDAPASTSDESNILHIGTTNVLTMPAMEEQVEIVSMAGVLDAKSNQLERNEGGDLGGSSEGIGALGARSKQPDEVGDPDLPAFDESNIPPVETSNVLTMPAMEKQLEIPSAAATSNQPNEVGDLGGSSEEVGALGASSKHAAGVGDPDVPASTSNVSNILPVEASNVLIMPATEEQVEIASSTGALVAGSKQPNEVGDSGGSSEEIVSVSPLPPEEHTEVLLEDPTREHLLEVSGMGSDVVPGNDNSEVNNVTEELNAEHDSLENISHLQNDEDNPRDAVRPTDTNQISPLELVVDFPSVAAVCSDDGGSLPQNQSSGYNGTLTHEMPYPENRSGTQVEVDAGQYGANSSEAVLISSSEQQQPASDGLSLAAHEPPSDIRHEIHNGERNLTPNLGYSCHLDGETMEPLQTGGNSEERPSVDVEMSPLSCEMTNFSEVRRVDPRPIPEQGASSHNIGTPVQVPGSAELPNQAVLQHNTNAAVVQGPRNRSVHPDHQMATWNSTLPFNADPLHKDWERIHKEKEQGTKILEDMKLRLRSDCQKEVEEMIAQIHKKYDHKLQEADAEFLRKKKELDVNQNKVLMNKLLADAFRCKCMNLKPSGLPGMRQVVPSSYLQHLRQVSQQPNLRSSPATASSSASQQSLVLACLRASPVTSLSSADQPQVRQETSVPSNRSVHSGGISQPTIRGAPVTGLSLAGQPVPTQQTAAVSRSKAHSAGTPSRPPLISAITPSTGNIRIAGEIRAPAPHLQPFRSPPSMSTSSSSSTLAQSMQNHQQSTNTAASLPSLPQLASLRTSSPSPSQPPQNQIPTPLVPLLAVDLSSSRNAATQHDFGGLPAVRSPSISAQELLFNVENQPHAKRPSIMPPLPDVGSDFDLLDLSEFQTLDGVQGVSTSSAGATNVTDVVCVSDDD